MKENHRHDIIVATSDIQFGLRTFYLHAPFFKKPLSIWSLIRNTSTMWYLNLILRYHIPHDKQRHRYREVKPQISTDFYQLKICVGRQDFVDTTTFKKNVDNTYKVEYIESYKLTFPSQNGQIVIITYLQYLILNNKIFLFL